VHAESTQAGGAGRSRRCVEGANGSGGNMGSATVSPAVPAIRSGKLLGGGALALAFEPGLTVAQALHVSAEFVHA